MSIERNIEYLKRNLSLHLHNLISPEFCGEIIARYDESRDNGQLEVVKKALVEECRERVFSDELVSLLTRYFNGPVTVCWPIFEVVGSAGSPQNQNALWHLDGGIRGTHKLFIYLNPVAEHGGNTVMVNQELTRKLQIAGALPLESAQRTEDLSGFFETLEIRPQVLAYDLNAGDGILFDPLTLAHRCQPASAGKQRYTIGFTLVPGSSGIDGIRFG